MKNMMKKIAILMLSIIILAMMLTSCGEKKKLITVYATSEDFRIELAQKMVDEKFPEYDVRIEYKSTGDLAAKLISEGNDTDCDIIYELENVYLEKIQDNLAELKDVDFGVYLDELVPESKKYAPLLKTRGVIVANNTILAEKNLEAPKTYDDLLKPEYKGLISMPNPKTSSTGYFFYLALVNEKGEDAALKYFDDLAKNISDAGFTSSGAGPLQQLKLGEAGIAFGMAYQAVTEINGGADFEILSLGGAPYDLYSSAVIAGKETDEDVMKVFNYLIGDVCVKDKELYGPEKIFKDKDFTMENYPKDNIYADMSGITDIKIKEELLNKWKY